MSGSIWSLLIDNQNRLWVGTTNGLLLFDRQTKDFTYYPVGSGTIRAMVEVPGKYLLLGLSYGLVKCSLDGQPIRSDYEKTANVPVRDIRSLYAASDGKLYIGYSDGFGVMDIQSDSIENFYTTHNGLSSNYIGCICEDAEGRIWLGSASSVCNYSRHQKLFYNYYISVTTAQSCFIRIFCFGGIIKT